MKKLYIILVFLLSATFMRAQQDPQYTQYMYNTMSVNPAYAGSRGQLSIAALYRSQWVGLDGAPKTQTLNLHSPIRNSKLGYGISIVNDNIGDGVVQETYFDAVIGQAVKIGELRVGTLHRRFQSSAQEASKVTVAFGPC